MVTEALQKSWHDLGFGVERSVRYHMRREGFFDFASRVVLFIGTIFGSATFVALANGSPAVAQAAAIVITLASALDLVFGFTAKARVHFDLRRRFLALQQRMLCAPDETLLHDLCRERLAIEADEPPIFRALDLMTHNEVMRAHGMDERDPVYAPHYHRLPWWRRVLANLLRQEHVADALRLNAPAA